MDLVSVGVLSRRMSHGTEPLCLLFAETTVSLDAGRQMKGYEGSRMEIMKGDKAAGAAKSRPEWRSCRETNKGRQGGRGSQEQARMEITQGDK